MGRTVADAGTSSSSSESETGLLAVLFYNPVPISPVPGEEDMRAYPGEGLDDYLVGILGIFRHDLDDGSLLDDFLRGGGLLLLHGYREYGSMTGEE